MLIWIGLCLLNRPPPPLDSEAEPQYICLDPDLAPDPNKPPSEPKTRTNLTPERRSQDESHLSEPRVCKPIHHIRDCKFESRSGRNSESYQVDTDYHDTRLLLHHQTLHHLEILVVSFDLDQNECHGL